MHALMNVLRFAAPTNGSEFSGSVLSEQGTHVLEQTRELDYMTHWVFRMFENKS